MAVNQQIAFSLSLPSQASESTTPTTDDTEPSTDADREVPPTGTVQGNCARVEKLAIWEGYEEAREEPPMSCETTSRYAGQKVVENPAVGPGENDVPVTESGAHDEEREAAEDRTPVNKAVKKLRTAPVLSNDHRIEKLVLDEGDGTEEETSTALTKKRTTPQDSVQREVKRHHLPATNGSVDHRVHKLALTQEHAAAKEKVRTLKTFPHDPVKKGLNKLVAAAAICQMNKLALKQEYAGDENTVPASKTPRQDAVQEIEGPKDATDEVNNHLVNESVLNEDHDATCKGTLRIVKRPKRDAFQKKFEETEQKLDQIVKKRESAILTVKEVDEIEELNKVLKKLGQRINALTVAAEKQRKRRLQLKEKLAMLEADNPSLDDFTEDSDAKHRRLSEQKEQTELLRVTKEVALALCSPEDRLRSKYISHCKSIDQLLEKLLLGGFKICRLESFLRLIPRQGYVENGKEFVSTLPVQLVHAHSSKHTSHIDTNFSFAVMSYVKEVCSWFGPKLCSFLSIDDKARVPIEFTAAAKDAPLLLHVEYKMESQNAAKDISNNCYKLMSSVYASCVISLNNLFQPIVSFNGPTYIAVRSGEHDNMAFTHGRDIEHLLKLDAFKDVMCNEIGEPKPILVCTVDGWSDEYPSLSKTLRVTCNQFRLHNLDVYLVATQAPGALAHPHVERRLAPLSRVLFGLIITNGLSGTPDDSGKIIDTNLEVVNFKKVGDALAEVWSSTVVDGYSVISEYVEPVGLQLEKVSPKWEKNHVRESQYLLQIVRCNDRTCCTEWRSNWNKVFPKRFLPAPYSLQQTTCGLRVPESGDAVDCHMYTSISQRMAFDLRPASESKQHEVPFDFHCPSVHGDLEERLCNKCGMYFASRLAVERHAVIHSDRAPGPSVGAEGDAAIANSCVMSQPQDSAKDPVFRKISDIMLSPWRKVGGESICL